MEQGGARERVLEYVCITEAEDGITGVKDREGDSKMRMMGKGRQQRGQMRRKYAYVFVSDNKLV